MSAPKIVVAGMNVSNTISMGYSHGDSKFYIHGNGC